MCIIVYKSATAKFPEKKVLKTCFDNNDDGAGYMYAANGKVYIRKGFMTFKDFWKDLNDSRKKYGDKLPYVMHFRISTQAGINPSICHPYPVSENMDDLYKLRSVATVGIAHNGIISLTSSYKKDVPYNDTMKFITDYASLIIDDDPYYYQDAKKIRLLEQLANSKLAILSADGHCELIGEFVALDGVYYSNYSYIASYAKPYTYSYLTDEDEWADFYDPATKTYDFDLDCCPMMLYGDSSFCSKCRQYAYCHEYNWVT